ncbi:succinate dehydrogenase assembly factor 4, mitochondrial [Anopheles nili]|uniref:succinate dehydrogenase assembly factor 4, mitochondrial n=1 Tax=Anopheles nili TaxID=185578 RepID=UPI00237A467A|nr:succinate dehydrogenase assembly factor 4, mitochondrial [Anopheles nili]XP_053676385.1 succinate dehydrogenase assembly factor 4, mitochondrial [Anopheles nili]
MTSKVLLNKFSSSIRHVYVVNFVPSLSFATNKPPSEKPASPRMEEFQKKLREKTPIGKLDEIVGKHPYQEKEPLEAWPNNTNPNTGEIGGPRGPEPTRYGDWERKGRVTDF